MDRMPDFDAGNPVTRLSEMDREVNASAIIVTVVSALASLPFWSRDPALVYAGFIPLLMRGLRYLLVDSDRSLYRWSLCNGFVTGAAVTVAASVSGGLGSPIIMFTIVIGVMTSMLFAHQPLWNLYPFALVAGIAAIDWLDNGIGEIDWLVPVSVVLVALSVPRLVSDMVGIELSYREKAVIDPLTGCLNRSSLKMRMNELLHQAELTADHIGVVAIDIDHFKLINDKYGHSVGDEVLQQVAYTIRRNLRRFELLYRTGGEEFLLLLPGAPADVAFRLGESIRQTVAREQFQVGRVTISVGTASELAPSSLDELIERADQSLLDAKAAGRNQTVQSVG